MKRINKTDLPEFVGAIFRDDRKTVDVCELLKRFDCVIKAERGEALHRDLCSKKLRRKGFDEWVERELAKAQTRNDRKRIEFVLCKMQNNPDFTVEILQAHTKLQGTDLVFDFASVKAEELR